MKSKKQSTGNASANSGVHPKKMQNRVIRRDVFTPASRIVDAVDNGYRWAAVANLAALAKVVFVYLAKGAGDAK